MSPRMAPLPPPHDGASATPRYTACCRAAADIHDDVDSHDMMRLRYVAQDATTQYAASHEFVMPSARVTPRHSTLPRVA